MRRSVRWLVVLAFVMGCGGGAARPPARTTATATARADAEPRPDHAHVAMILLAEPRLPSADAVIAAYQQLAPAGPALTATPSEDGGTLAFALGDAILSVGLMPAPVPGREADDHAAFSLQGITGWRPPAHAAHLLVLHLGDPTRARLDQVRTFTHLVAAIGASSPAVGIYVGQAGATFEPAFYARAVRELPDPMYLWSGVSVAGTGDQVSLLSTGLDQFGLPELEVRTSRARAPDALALMYDVMLYLVKRGEAIPDGDTLGFDAETRYRVTYVPSPIDPATRVMMVELP